LLPEIRQRVLATTLLDPERSWYLRELAARLELTPSSLQRELQNLVEAGILKATKNGNRAYYQSDKTSPFFSELQSIMRKSSGGVDVLRDALEPFKGEISHAFIYGSFASQTNVRNISDVDLMVVGEIRPRQLTDTLARVEQALGREVNSTVYTPIEFKQKLSEGHHFLNTVMACERLPILGDMDVLATTSESRKDSHSPDKPSRAN
jgi:predicted nucleotidyltransferase